MGGAHLHADPLYQHLLLTAEKKFWRCVMSGAAAPPSNAHAPLWHAMILDASVSLWCFGDSHIAGGPRFGRREPKTSPRYRYLPSK